MPSSFLYQVVPIMSTIIEINPESILDIGIGYGKYGFLSREYLELPDQDGNLMNWKRRIDAIEVYEKYITPIHKLLYSNIYIGNALRVVDELKTRYDLTILIDVLEHFERKDGTYLIRRLLKISKGILIATPRHFEQSECFGNPFEKHLSEWDPTSFSDIAPIGIILADQHSLICYLGNKDFINTLNRRYYSKIYHRFPNFIRNILIGKKMI